MYRNLNGLRSMNRMPECVVVVDPRKEKNAIREARRLGLTTIALIDTDCDPDDVDLPIPGNDDGIRSIELVLQVLADAVMAGRANAAVQAKQEVAHEAKPASRRRRRSRSDSPAGGRQRSGRVVIPEFTTHTGHPRGERDMGEISAAAVRAFREKTGLPLMDCKRALTEANGDEEKAIEMLRKAGEKLEAKRADRVTEFGRFGIYCGLDKNVGAMVELKCESAPVTQNEEFIQLANDLARQLATRPRRRHG